MTTYYENNHDEIKELLLGHKITNVDLEKGTATLDDDTVLELHGNEGCGGCNSGWYDLTVLNSVDNIITNVEFLDEPDEEYRERGCLYQIFAFADNQKINFATFEGSDGNAYYGSGYSIKVRKA